MCPKLYSELLGKMAVSLGIAWAQSLFSKLELVRESVGQLHQYHVPTWKCRLLSPTPDLLNQNIWGGTQQSVSTRIMQSNVCSSLGSAR